ncbi:MAG: hypothetical protein KJO55_07435 [Gammaproteobacteria bacterium]|nr:hypothetical protein [Gammaproteobacteria bacterium]NND59641.1 hypothetical protein [Gammaproteobacteria bacterium]
MKKALTWHSPRIQQQIKLVRWGHWGVPVLLFPTAGGDAEEIERFHLIGALWPLIESGKVKVYSCDSLAGRAWISDHTSAEHSAWVQNRYLEAVYHEVVPAIRHDCQNDDIEIVTAGASIGAFNAVASICRHPDVFSLAIGLSGTYDLERQMPEGINDDFYFSSPLHFVPNLGENEILDQLRKRFVLMAFGAGRWENPEQTWRMASVLGLRGIPNRVDEWHGNYDHDWPAWREQLPQYLADHV